MYTEAQRQLVIARAIEAAQAHIDGKSIITLGKGITAQQFILWKGGYCERFIRQVFETALGLPEMSWQYKTAQASQAEAAYGQDKRVSLDQLQAGDILVMASGAQGHTALYLNTRYDPTKKLVAENTLSTRRGMPSSQGTKISSLHDEDAQHVWTHAYRLFG